MSFFNHLPIDLPADNIANQTHQIEYGFFFGIVLYKQYFLFCWEKRSTKLYSFDIRRYQAVAVMVDAGLLHHYLHQAMEQHQAVQIYL